MFLITKACLEFGAAGTADTPTIVGNGMREGFDQYDFMSGSEGGPVVDWGPTHDGDDEETEETNEGSGESGLSSSDREPQLTDAPVSKVPEAFKPYEFKGKVNGEEVAQQFATQKDLDRTIANGLLAPKLHTALLAAKKDVAALKADAEWGRDLQNFAKEDPNGFLSHVFEHMLTEEAAAEFVYNKYQEFSKLANMTPEQRQALNTNKAAERILREQRYNQQLAEEARAEQAKAQQQQEYAKFESWKSAEVSKWTAKIPEQYRESIIENMKLVAAFAEKQISLGNEYSYKMMSKHLEKLLGPIVQISMSPSDKKREELAQTQAKTKAETEKLRNMSQTEPVNARKPKNIGDVFQKLRREVSSSGMFK